MKSRNPGKPSRRAEESGHGPNPAGRTRRSRRATPPRERELSHGGAPKSVRPDTLAAASCGAAPAAYAGIIPSKKPPEPPEALSQKGAMTLAKRLERYWQDQGFPSARFWAVPIGEQFPKVGTYELYRVESNLVDGLPPRYLSR